MEQRLFPLALKKVNIKYIFKYKNNNYNKFKHKIIYN